MPTEKKSAFPKWNFNELRLALLVVLRATKKKFPAAGGMTGKTLIDVLKVDREQLQEVLDYGLQRRFIEIELKTFFITDAGLEYLQKFFDSQKST